MSLADKIFVNMCKDILENGTSTEGEKVRPHWEDGTSAYTIKKFGVVNRYDLSKEFPAITLRKTAIKTCTEEMLWIWQRKSNNIHDLNSTVWDEWADEDGSIGKAYGYQLGVKHQYKEGMMDQVDRVSPVMSLAVLSLPVSSAGPVTPDTVLMRQTSLWKPFMQTLIPLQTI
jgi:thymidylate synthase